MKNKGYLSILIGLIGIGLSVFSFFYTPKKGLEIKIEKIENLLDLKDDGLSIKVYLRDSIEIDSRKKNISIFQIEIKNNGENITINDFDSNLGFGLILKNGQIVKKPEIMDTSDSEYFKNVMESVTENQISFSKKIIDTDNYFRIKFFVLHDNNEIPELQSYGRISGQGSIPVFNKIPVNRKQQIGEYEEKIKLVYISLIFTLLGFAGLVYAYLKSIKNQRLLSEQQLVIENFMEEKNVLLREIQKLSKN